MFAAIALLADTNLLMIGLPGEAKTRFALAVLSRLEGTRFVKSLKPGTTVEEVLGLPDFGLLKRSIHKLVPAGLPQANYAFLDELFRGPEELLSSLLDIILEKLLREGISEIQVPLLWSIAASNFVIMEKAMQAVLDRFPIRIAVGTTGVLDRYRVMTQPHGNTGDVIGRPMVGIDDVLYLRELVGNTGDSQIYAPPHLLFLANEVATLLEQSQIETSGSTIVPRRYSTRTLARIPDILKIIALLNGRFTVSARDLKDGLSACLVPAVMGSMNDNLFDGVNASRIALADLIDKTLSKYADESVLAAIDTMLAIVDIVDAGGKVSPASRKTLGLNTTVTKLSFEEMATFLNKSSDLVANHSELLDTLSKSVVGLMDASAQRNNRVRLS